MDIPAMFSLVAWIVTFGVTLWGTWYALRQFRVEAPSSVRPPPVSILKPVKGLDADLERNLRSFLRQEFPEYEVIFAFADANDAALPLVRRLIAEHPHVPARICIGARDVGSNPKVNNLVEPYDAARHDVLLVADSNVWVPRDFLRRIVSYLRDDVGVVSGVVAGRFPEGLGGFLEATYLNSFYARWMHISSAFGHSCVVGKSMLFRRSTMDRIGGIARMSNYIAEDYQAGQALKRLGLRLVLMAEPVHQHVGEHPFNAFWQRHLRWGRIRKSQAPLAFLVEPLFMSFGSGALGAIALSSAFDISAWQVFVGHVAVWMMADQLLMRRLERRWRLRMVPAWLLRETLSLPLWVHMAVGSSVNWRGNRLRILPGGLLADVPRTEKTRLRA